MPGQLPARDKITHQLRERLSRWENAGGPAQGRAGETFSAGAAALDRLFPGGGLRHGMLVEWLAEHRASRAATLSLLAAREAARQGGIAVVIDRRQMFYPPAAAAWGIDLDRLLLVHPRSPREELWAAVQALRSPVVAAVWAAIDRIDDRAFRLLQLAAEVGHTLGLLLRPANARGQPSWADMRLGVETKRRGGKEIERQLEQRHRRLFSLSPSLSVSLSIVRVLHCREGRAGRSAFLEIDDATHAIREIDRAAAAHSSGPHHDDTHSLSLVAELGDSASRPFSAGA
jgi:hypothetical protein